MSQSQSPLLGVYGVQFSYSGARESLSSSQPKRVLNEISFEIERGKVIALLGPNGCGKSTLLKIVSGMIPLSVRRGSGQIRYLGQNFLALSPMQRSQRVVYLGPELKAEFPLTALEVVRLGRDVQSCDDRFGILQKKEESLLHGEKIQWAMEKCLCWSLRDRQLSSLSGGERQLVALARALAQESQVLLLDEALSKMDLNHQAAMGSLLKELAAGGKSILLVSHDMNLASEWADEAIVLRAGEKLCQGSIREVFTEKTMQLLYSGSRLVMGSNPSTGAPKVFFGPLLEEH